MRPENQSLRPGRHCRSLGLIDGFAGVRHGITDWRIRVGCGSVRRLPQNLLDSPAGLQSVQRQVTGRLEIHHAAVITDHHYTSLRQRDANRVLVTSDAGSGVALAAILSA